RAGNYAWALYKELAEHPDGQSISLFREFARRHAVMVVVGLPTRSDTGYHISQMVIGQSGELLGGYHKMHLAHYGASMEKDYFSSGSRLLVVECQGYRLAPVICYDIRFPELSRSLALEHGVDVLLHCGAYYRDESFASWHPFVVTRAMENQHYVLSLNRAGQHYGASVLAPPWIDEANPMIRLHENREEFKHLVIRREAIERVRRDYTFLRDRKPFYRT
nr:carbon-nitrogen hydrolase family protein [Granulosicoccus sp.]